MPHRLKERQEKMAKKIKKDNFRTYLKTVVSWSPLMFYKNNWLISIFPEVWRISDIQDFESFSSQRDTILQKWLTIASNISFFWNFSKLIQNITFPATIKYMTNENSEYADSLAWVKNVYLSSNITFWSENVLYSFSVKNNNTNILNSVAVNSWSHNIYFCSWITTSHNIFYSRYITNSSNIWFSDNLVNCRECISCNNLEHTTFCINNKQYKEKEYYIQKEKILKEKKSFAERYATLNAIWKNIASENIEWSAISHSDNIENGYLVHQIKNGKNLIMVWWKDACQEMYNCFQCASKLENFNYSAISAGRWEHLYCNYNSSWSSMYYTIFCENCSYCLGCIGLKNKSYCILNKQYTKEERHDKVDEIFTQMEKDWTLWKFFPWSMNPFYFNDTAAYLIDDTFTKEEVEAEGYLRRDEKIKVDIPEGAEIVYVNPPQSPFSKGGSEAGKETSNSPSLLKRGSGYPISEIGNKVPKVDSGAERWIDPEILKKVIQDKEGNYYKIVKMEYDFLMKHGLPLPKLHWLDRIKLGFTFK